MPWRYSTFKGNQAAQAARRHQEARTKDLAWRFPIGPAIESTWDWVHTILDFIKNIDGGLAFKRFDWVGVELLNRYCVLNKHSVDWGH
jgi:hypothetical protein